MTVKALVDFARALPGYSGMMVFIADREAFADQAMDFGPNLRSLQRHFPGVAGHYPEITAVAGGYTYLVFDRGNLTVVLKLAGRFAALPDLSLEEPDFIDPSSLSLPPREDARREAEALLRGYDLF